MNELRRKYEDLCARLMEQTARDPVSEGAIIEELQRLSDQIVALAQEADMNGPSGHGKGTAGSPGDHPAGTHRTDPSLGKVLALLERQSRDVERILRRSDEHRDQLERVERRLVETMPLIERQLPELRAATELQRQRITALAIAVQRLFQWLASHRGNQT